MPSNQGLSKSQTQTVVLIAVLLLIFFVSELNFKTWWSQKDALNSYPELAQIPAHDSSFQTLALFFKELAEKKGAAYAFEVLKAAPLPPNTDLHLLGHTVGDVLYEQKGAEGITVCTQDFRNACSHAIVVGLLLEEGEGSLSLISDICRRAPGGSGAYTMCFHGLGHGVLAYSGYDLEKTIKLCEKTGTAAYGNREFGECVSGAVMELISGGFHNRELWEKAQTKYFKKNDPLYPCTAAFMPEVALSLCYVYITPHLFNLAGADGGRPAPEDYRKAFPFCNALSPNDKHNRDYCYGGFGKEFVVLAQDRDIRKIETMTREQFLTVYDWCRLADNRDGTAACITHAMNSVYWGGENNRSASLRFCGVIDDPGFRDVCFSNLIGNIGFYIKDQDYKNAFCAEIPREYQTECLNRLKLD